MTKPKQALLMKDGFAKLQQLTIDLANERITQEEHDAEKKLILFKARQTVEPTP